MKGNKLLDLFSGTGSVTKIAQDFGFEVTTLDLNVPTADINIDILNWDYKNYHQGFDVIWASPPCQFFSKLRYSNIGRNGMTRDTLDADMLNLGVPLLRRTQEIIAFFRPRVFFIENPQTGRMKDFIANTPFFDVDYCMYGFDYRKRTRIWTNSTAPFSPRICNGNCGNVVKGRHISQVNTRGGGRSKSSRYRIPDGLIYDLIHPILATEQPI